jgi:pyruvate dehydrogenase E2 component (dihydrolipoamide acetyltransferase)
MPTGIYVPIWGLQMTEATVSEWLVEEGQEVTKGQGVVVIETYKISGEVESPVDGVLRRHTAQTGQILPVGHLLCVVGTADETEAAVEQLIKEVPFVTDLAVTEISPCSTTSDSVVESKPHLTPTDSRPFSQETAGTVVRATPLARKQARELGLDLSTVKGSGPSGRIYSRDIEAARTQSHAEAPFVRPVEDQVIPLTTLRRAIISKTMQTVDIPYGALSRIVRMDRLIAFQKSLADPFKRKYGLKLSMTHLFFKATSIALQETPILNSSLDGENIIIKGSINVGMVVTPPDGGGILIPVVKDVQRKSLDQIARDWATIIERVQTGTFSLEDLSGGSFTISNAGPAGIDVFTPLIHPPESAILGISRLREEPVVEGGQVVPGRTLSLIVGADHRVFDADPIGQFLTAMDRLFQNPNELLI